MTQYEIWWAILPPPAGRRPVLLLSRPAAYEYLNKFIAAEVTTTVRGIIQEVPLGRAEGLDRACVATMDNIRTVARSQLSEKIGQVAAARVPEVKRALGAALDWREWIEG